MTIEFTPADTFRQSGSYTSNIGLGLTIIETELVPPGQMIEDPRSGTLYLHPETFAKMKRRLWIQDQVRAIVRRVLADRAGGQRRKAQRASQGRAAPS